MAKKQAVPEGSSRESPVFWEQMIDSSYKRRTKVLRDAEEYARWHRGDLSGVVDPKALTEGYRWQRGLENMTALAITASLADLLFRWPRFNVVPPYAAQSPMFMPQLAKCETMTLNHTIKRVDFLTKARRALQDTLIGGMGILMITADSDIVVDEMSIEAARAEALKEIQDFLAHGVKFVAKEDQLHSIHIEVKRGLLTEAERGNIPLPKPAIRYLRQHIAKHEQMKMSDRPTETIRTSEIKVSRVNCLDYAYDATTDDRDEATWEARRFLMRKVDVVNNSGYDENARKQVQTISDRWVSRNHSPSVQTQGSYDIPEDMVMVWEVFDYIEQKRRLFADRCSVMLIPEEDRLLLADVQPSGPFHKIVFIEDANETHGVSPINGFAGEQAAATHIAAANVSGAIESRPRTLINKRDIDEAQAKFIQNAPAGSVIMLDLKGDVNRKISDAFDQVPASEIHPQNLLIKADMIHGIERRSGLGVAKMGGGETSSTATGAALGADASNSISEDRGALVDSWMQKCGRTIVRLTRQFAPKSKIVAICGEIAIESWPERWAIEDVRNDIGVDVIPGSSRRVNTNVDQKQILDGIGALSNDAQLSQLVSTGKLKVQMFQRFFEDAGIDGLDWRSVEDELAMQQAMMQAAMGMPPGDPQAQMPAEGSPDSQDASEGSGGPGGYPGAPNRGSGAPSASSSPNAAGATQPNDLAQGVANTGGGRIATGASTGDKIRVLRGGAKERIANRG